MMKVQWISSTQQQKWKMKEIESYKISTQDANFVNNKDESQFAMGSQKKSNIHSLSISSKKAQIIDGFGGCFNELGWIALSKLKSTDRHQVLRDLFDPQEGAGFNFCRTPIGASDYAQQWYSLNEHEGDLSMEHFSIERDHKHLLPYIKSALDIQSDIKLFASPWSPPTWMKTSQAYNYGRLKMEKENLDAYALYFKKYIEAYKEEGIKIDQVHIQNEPFADQKFPSCLWSAEQFRVFIGEHLGPLFETENMDTEIWLGTLNGPTQMSFTMAGITLDLYDKYVDHILFDENALKYIKGIGYQWAGQQVVQRTHDSFPELKLMQTENECGNGTNTWEYAAYVFNLMRHYFTNGTNSYIYWNMVLEPKGLSTWGWNQNALITVDPETKTAIYNPEYYVMKHFSKFIKPGAYRLETSGHFCGSALAFENPTGDIIVVMSNALDYKRDVYIIVNNYEICVTLEANSFNTLVIN